MSINSTISQRPVYLGVEKRGKHKMTQIHFTEFHLRLLQFLARTRWARDIQIAGWLGCSLSSVNKALGYLKTKKLVKSLKADVYLRDFDSNTLSERKVTVWGITQKAAHEDILGYWEVPGYEDDERTVTKVAEENLSQINHRLSINDIAVIFARHGFEIAFESDIRHLDGTGFLTSKRLQKVWTVGKNPHVPDLGIIDPQNREKKWGIEVERRQGTIESYVVKISQFKESKMGQLWFCQSQRIVNSLLKACETLGISMHSGEYPYGMMWYSSDALIRICLYSGGVATPMPTKYKDYLSRRSVFWDVASGLKVMCTSSDGKNSIWESPHRNALMMGFPSSGTVNLSQEWRKRGKPSRQN